MPNICVLNCNKFYVYLNVCCIQNCLPTHMLADRPSFLIEIQINLIHMSETVIDNGDGGGMHVPRRCAAAEMV